MCIESKPILSLSFFFLLYVYLSKRVLSICILTNSGPRLLLLVDVKKNQEREREICRCIANQTFLFLFLFFPCVLFLSQSIHHIAQLFCLCSHTQSNIALFVVVVVFTCFLFFIHLSNYALPSKYIEIYIYKEKRRNDLFSGTVFRFFSLSLVSFVW